MAKKKSTKEWVTFITEEVKGGSTLEQIIAKNAETKDDRIPIAAIRKYSEEVVKEQATKKEKGGRPTASHGCSPEISSPFGSTR